MRRRLLDRRVALRAPRDDVAVSTNWNHDLDCPRQRPARPICVRQHHRSEQNAHARLVANLHLLRRRMARGQRPDRRRAHPWLLAGVERVRRRARLRGGDARSRQALRPPQPLGPVDGPEADDERRGDGRARGRGGEEIPSGRRTLYPPDVLARTGQRDERGGAGRGLDPLLPLHLRGAAARADRRVDNPIPIRQAARRHHADRRQGGLPLSQQRARPDRGPRPRLRQLPHVRHARQCRRARHRQCVHGQERRGDDPDRQWIIP